MGVQEQERQFEEQFFQDISHYEYEENQYNQPSQYDNYNNQSDYRVSSISIPQGFKYQIAAQKIQKYLRAQLAKRRVKRLFRQHNLPLQISQLKVNLQGSSDKNKYKRQKYECQECLQKFSNESNLQKHVNDSHMKQLDQIQLQLTRKNKRIEQEKYKSAKSNKLSLSLVHQQALFNAFSQKQLTGTANNFNKNGQISKFDQDISVQSQRTKVMPVSQSTQGSHNKQRPSKFSQSIQSSDLKDNIHSELQSFRDYNQIKKNVPQLKNINKSKQQFQSTKKTLYFTPKSQRLNQPMLYEFDLYIRAATEIQRHFRGFLVRKKIFGNFKRYRQVVVKVQRLARRFLELKIQKYQKYQEFLEIKSKKIILELKNFCKIYQKFDKLRSNQSSIPLKSKQMVLLNQSEKYRKYIEKGYSQIRQKFHHSAADSSTQTEENNFPQSVKFQHDSHHQQDMIDKDQLIQSLKSELAVLKMLLRVKHPVKQFLALDK
ncbi:UNKNOWN [Stylonychia lemnae]|uniref:C2H2-type domain-containing protein n=1 Tax=Stylonychia lemnae TaxID=5949 RepID=A0A078B3E4_STYLE|nr:UNKNOWN [Stylonychia lemnae]|eukprot:CDW87757.1 UNKNOWN [Stylonychia lemnae]